MKGNFLLFASLLAGVLVGMSGATPHWLLNAQLPMILLELLIVQVGMGIGSMEHLDRLFAGFRWEMLLLPAFTIVGTLLFTACAVFLFHGRSLGDFLAVGSGFGYYSLSSVLISQIKTGVDGAAAANQLATIALLANIVREMVSLLGCRYVAHRGSGWAAISVAGISSMDVCLPSILSSTGNKRYMPVAIFHGLCLEVSVPMLVTFFCSVNI
ncbi:MAG: lysine exporter LysO family protein [Prevotella sp.]|uniref:lysine exporter LysO family protein n=1 Tax=Prevotella sp. TaxID=59823 RepID=UPI00258C6E8A|nr:lysine exporter LysO family protein [Prevotella sp.]MDD6853099.1 lysine exporter LysO family protein [Prevotella sp.]